MVNVILSSDNVTVLGGPSRLDVDLNIGATGNRGSLIFSLNGNPNLRSLDRGFPTRPQIFDIYIDSAAFSDNFLQAYQFVNQDGIETWVEVFSLRQDVFNVNEVVEFSQGKARILVNLTSLGLEKLPFEFLLNSFASFNVSATISNVDIDDVDPQATIYPLPTALSVYAENAVFDSTGLNDPSQFPLILPINISAVEFDNGSWSEIDDKELIVYLTISFANPSKILSNVDVLEEEEGES